MSKRSLAHLLLLLTVLVWGATFTLVKSAFVDISPLLFNPIRFVLAAVALAAVNHRQLRLLNRGHLKLGAVAGLFLAAGYQFQVLGLDRTTPTKSAFITGLVVVFVPLLSLVPPFRAASAGKPGISSALGVALAFGGLILLTTPSGTTFGTMLTAIGIGDFLTLICAMAFAAHVLTLARASKVMPPGLLATLQIGFAAIFMVAAAPLQPEHFNLTPRAVLTLLITAILGTAAAFTVQSFAQRILPPTHTVVLLSLEPVFAWLISVLFLHEVLAIRAFVGAALILAGIVVTELLPVANATEIPV